MAENEVTKLKKRRGLLKASLTRFKTFLDNYDQERDYKMLKIRYEKVKDLLPQYEDVQLEIEIAENSSEDEARQLFENSYYEQLARAQEFLDVRERNAQATSNAMVNSDIQAVITCLSNLTSIETGVKLPTITLPKFDGKYEEWLTFEDSFKALVHDNAKIHTVQKFNYLKSCLIGNAAQIIQSLNSTAENYEITWNLLRSRYSNKRIIIQNHVKALFELQAMSKESAIDLSTLIDTALKHIHSLQVLQEQPIEGWDALLLYLIGSKVDKETQKEWEKSLDGTDMPTTEQYWKFLRNRCHVLEAIPNKSSNKEITSENKAGRSSKVTSGKTKQVLFEAQGKVKCHVCEETHNIQNCNRFKSMSPSERSDSIKKSGLCFNCFRPNHRVSECKASSCKKCDRRHHTMLHQVRQINVSSQEDTNQQSDQSTKEVESTGISQTLSSRAVDNYNSIQVLLSTAVVSIVDASGHYHSCRVVLDAGSQSNFISERLCDELKLCKTTVNVPIKGIGESLSHIKFSTSVNIESNDNSFKFKVNCLVIERLTDLLPSRPVNGREFNIPSKIRLADPNFDKPAKVDMLLGAEHFYQLLCVGQIKLLSGALVLQKTRLGWIVAGKINALNSLSSKHCCISQTALEEAVQRFWEVEELPSRKILSPSEEACEQHYKQTTERLSSGRYSLRLPFNEEKYKLGESYNIARRKLQALERRLSMKPEIYKDYRCFLKEYETLGHMTKAKYSNSQEGYFLPHHAVLKESSTTTKLRVVFDASSKTTTGFSLNDVLLSGPVVQQDLFSIVARFRLHEVAVTADIEKMYRQVFIHEEDRQFQKILWRDNVCEEIRTYELNTVTYGVTSVPFLATRTLVQLAHDEEQAYPDAAEIVRRDMYVDDLLTGANTVEQALKLKLDITSLLNRAGFKLRKWTSNHPQLRDDVTESDLNEHINLDPGEVQRTLGLLWNPQRDCLEYRVTNNSDSHKVTKRLILSQTATLYDPLGLLGPIILKAKIPLQELWKMQLSWDEPVPMEIQEAWTIFQENKLALNHISFPRHIIITQSVDLQLHGFADASESAFGACIYVRSSNALQIHQSRLVCSKSRVAPLKKLSVPRLELCAALLLSQLCQTVLKALDVTFSKIILWSDSTIALQWITTHPHRLKTFVANRVAIQEITSKFEWRHVASQDNLADLVSRGTFSLELMNNSIWYHGPSWFTESEEEWPTSFPTIAEIPEQRSKITLKIERDFDILEQFSSIVKLRRVVAWCFRFFNNCRSKATIHGSLSNTELNQVMLVIIRLVQRESFAQEIHEIESKRAVNGKSKLISLRPFLDTSGILRVEGRLEHSKLAFEQKHQIILPEKHYITDLIIRHAHESQIQCMLGLKRPYII